MDNLDKLSRLRQDDVPGWVRGWQKPFFIELQNNFLAYRLIGREEVTRTDRETMDLMLRQFVALVTAPDEEILGFANRWGILGLCEHGMPATHIINISKQESILPIFQYCNANTREDWGYEPLEQWRYYARQVSAISSLSYMPSLLEPEEDIPGTVFGINVLQNGKVEIHGLPGDEEDWNALFGDLWFCYLKPDRIMAARGLIAFAIERLFKLTHVRPGFSWKNRKPDFHFYGCADEHGLFEALVMNLMLNVSRARGFSVCRECANSFLIDQTHRNANYCPECKKMVQHRQAVRKSYQRDRENPDRKKQNRLLASEKEKIVRTIEQARQRGEKISSLIAQLAKEHMVTTSAIHKIIKNQQDK